MTPWVTISSRVCSICSLYSMGTFLGHVGLGDGKVSPDGICARHLANCIEGAGEGLLQGNHVPGCHCGMGGCLSHVGIEG